MNDIVNVGYKNRKDLCDRDSTRDAVPSFLDIVLKLMLNIVVSLDTLDMLQIYVGIES